MSDETWSNADYRAFYRKAHARHLNRIALVKAELRSRPLTEDEKITLDWAIEGAQEAERELERLGTKV